MLLRIIFSILFISFISSCSKEKIVYEDKKAIDPYVTYKEAFEAFENNDYFYANKKFLEAELNFDDPRFAAKSAIMSAFSLYGINFYQEAEENLVRYLKTYQLIGTLNMLII